MVNKCKDLCHSNPTVDGKLNWIYGELYTNKIDGTIYPAVFNSDYDCYCLQDYSDQGAYIKLSKIY